MRPRRARCPAGGGDRTFARSARAGRSGRAAIVVGVRLAIVGGLPGAVVRGADVGGARPRARGRAARARGPRARGAASDARAPAGGHRLGASHHRAAAPRARAAARRAARARARASALHGARARTRGPPAPGGRPGALPRARRGVRRSCGCRAARSGAARLPEPAGADLSRAAFRLPNRRPSSVAESLPNLARTRRGSVAPREPGGGAVASEPLACCRRWTSARACWCGASSTAWTSRRGERPWCTTTRAGSPLRPTGGSASATSRSPSTCAPWSSCWARAWRGASTSRSPAATCARGGCSPAGRAWRSSACGATPARRAEVRELVEEIVAAARTAAAQARAGQLEARPATCGFGGSGCMYPSICRCDR